MLVSVLINNYNYGKFLENCIQSVLQQTYRNIEIIVYDDGSSDNSLEILEKYKNEITIISNPNYGKSHDLNQANAIYQAFLRAKGDIICLLDSDDAFHNEKVGKIISIFETNPTCDCVQHPLYETNGVGNVKNTIRPVLKRVEDYQDYIFSSQNLFHLFVPTSGLVFKRDILQKLLPLEEDKFSNLAPDIKLMLNSVLLGNIKTIEEPLGYYRIHGSNDSSKRGSIEGLQQYTQDLYQYFNQLALKNGWYSISFDLDQFLKNTYFFDLIDVERIMGFLNDKDKNCEYWIWGAGEAGQTVLYSLGEKEELIKGFIDMNPQKRNAMIMNKKVLHSDDIKFSKEMRILVSPYHSYKDISDLLKAVGLDEKVHFIFPYKH